MLRTLHRRLILSHILPLLLITPIMGLALVYMLETRVLIPSLSSELQGQASLVAELASNQADLWQDPSRAHEFVDRVDPVISARVMVLDPEGRLLATSDPDDEPLLGQIVELSALPRILAGEISVHTTYSRDLNAEVVDALVPVRRPDGGILGAVRLTHQQESVYVWFMQLRYSIAVVLLAAVIVAAALGWILAMHLQRPLRSVTRAVTHLADGREVLPLVEEGPEEIGLLSRSFNVLVERLQAMEQARRQLLGNLVHELARPLGAILSAVQALRIGAHKDPALREELLAGMEEEISRLRRLVESLIHLHDQALGPMELDCRAVDLTDWLPRTLVPWREAARGKGLEWQVTMPAASVLADIDPDHMAQAVGNLLSNAVKYTPTGGKIAVEVGVKDQTAWIKVSDTGPGISPEDHSRVFAPFYRGNRGHRFPQGMGLGLAIARDVASAHGGCVEVQSDLGLGAHFVLRFPSKSSRAP